MDDIETSASKNNKWRGAVAAGAILIAIWIGSSLIFNGDGIYSCEGLVPQVVKLSSENVSPLTNIKILDISHVTTVRAGTAESIECEGTAFLNDTTEQKIKYRIVQKNNKPWLLYEGV
ncbi:hypothetical protein F9L06_08025 [Brucella anthropi]|uniref:Uncharacterized protein n=1 Tax=Brucella anthropi TaxID=529 RepID=A0A6I0DW16_BRUAN|nr:hypothetical protein [Brucella anthropi]KAB2801616.1 hypothetical protein F9L06_08025 [Brucella anthropi]